MKLLVPQAADWCFSAKVGILVETSASRAKVGIITSGFGWEMNTSGNMVRMTLYMMVDHTSHAQSQ